MTKRKNPDQKLHLDWQNDVLPTARAIVESYDTEVTLRQLFYQLVSLPHGHPAKIPNQEHKYGYLGTLTAEGRRDGTFPDLIDERREIIVATSWNSPRDGIEALRDQYRIDHTIGQQYQIWLGVEKGGMVAQLRAWFEDFGIRIIAMGGQCSQPYITEITRTVEADGRPPILLYAGDHDPAGWRILTSFVDRTGYWENPELEDWDPAIKDMPPIVGYTHPEGKRSIPRPIPNYDLYRKYRLALQPEQCVEHDLPRNPAKENDNLIEAFVTNFGHTLTPGEVDDGRGVQIEVDALPPDELRRLFTDAIDQYWDDDAYEAAMAAEARDVAELDHILTGLD